MPLFLHLNNIVPLNIYHLSVSDKPTIYQNNTLNYGYGSVIRLNSHDISVTEVIYFPFLNLNLFKSSSQSNQHESVQYF